MARNNSNYFALIKADHRIKVISLAVQKKEKNIYNRFQMRDNFRAKFIN